MRKILAALIAVSMVSAASATTIEHEDVQVDLETSEVVVELQVEELTSSRLTYFTDHHMDDASASIGDSALDCQIFSSEGGSQISCETSARENFTAVINYSSQELVEQRNGENMFRMEKNFIRPTERYSMSVMLPRGSIIVQNETDSPIVPPDGEVNTDGQRISVMWDKQPSLGDRIEFSAEYRSFESDQNNELLRYIGMAAIAAVLVLGAYGALRLSRRQSLESVFDDLEDDEIEVLEKIAENSGSMVQKDLVDEMDYSKAKISGIVSGLVDEGIIEKQKEGRSNRLSLKRRFTY